MFIHPFRETRYGTVALSQKGILAFKVSSHKVQSVWQQLQSTYLFQGSMYLLCICPSPHNYIRFRFHMKTNCNNPSSDTKQLNNCCDTKQLLKFQERGKHKNTLTTKVSCLVSRSDQNSFHFLHSSGRFQWLNILHSNTFTTATQNNIRGYLMHLRNPTNVPKKVVSTCHLSQSVVNQQSQHQVPPCLQCHDGSYFSLSLNTPVPIRHAPLFLHTTEPQVFNYSHLISHMWQSNSFMNQGHWQSKSDPPGSHATVSLSYYHLQAWRQAQ